MKNDSMFKELNMIKTTEITEDVWMVEGYLSDDFIGRPPSSNIYLLRDDDSLLIVDTGYYSIYRRKMFEIIERYKKGGVKHINLVLTQGHFDHAANNMVLMESGLKWRFFLPEPELKTINFQEDFLEDIRNLGRYEDVVSTMFLMRGKSSVIRVVNAISKKLTNRIIEGLSSILFGGIQTLSEHAVVLYEKDRIKRSFGNVNLLGWEIGRFFIIHDAAHSPGHVSIYDSKNRIMLCGDVTVEVNPAFFYSSMERLLDTTDKFRLMAEGGHIQCVGDSHRTTRGMTRLLDKYRQMPFDDILLFDYYDSEKQCAAFFKAFHEYYSQCINDVIKAHRYLGETTVKEIVKVLNDSSSPGICYKRSLKFPELPSRMDVLVARVLKENGVIPRVEGDRILLAPV